MTEVFVEKGTARLAFIDGDSLRALNEWSAAPFAWLGAPCDSAAHAAFGRPLTAKLAAVGRLLGLVRRGEAAHTSTSEVSNPWAFPSEAGGTKTGQAHRYLAGPGFLKIHPRPR